MDIICQAALKDWRSLNGVIAVLKEDQIQEMLDHEVENGKRSTMVVRLHQKLTALRASRERAELILKISEEG